MISFYDMSHGTVGFTIFLAILYLINFILATTIIFTERKDPAATLAWVLVLFLIPAFGILLYFFFSQNISRHKIFKLTKDEERMMTSSLEKQERAICDGTFDFSTYEADKWRDLIRLNQNYGRAYYTQDNKMDVLVDGDSLTHSLIDDIRNAKDTINIMFFIVKPDEVGCKLIDELTKKAREGVDVRFLVDALGSRHIGDKVTKNFTEAGGKFAKFFPPKFRVFRYFNPKLNFRNHRKLVAIDDKIAYIGGYNVAKEYMGLKKKFGFWRDTHIRIEGGAVQDINFRFLQDWRASSNEEINVANVFFPPEKDAGIAGMQIVSGGPDTEHEQIKRAFLKMISGARKKIHIQTPYFVPDAPILESLKMAAQSGVDVNIMIPCKPDHVFVYWATYSYCGEIIKNGGRVFIYDDGFLHAKTMTVDGEISTVGSTNFDRRSFKLNFECNAFIYDDEATKKLDNVFYNDLKHCHELTKEEYKQRARSIKIKEPISRLLSDVL